ncbi:MAG: hypothetical protein QF827_11195 [Alphaproteobacteria bacterium]|nr:hypothetical protein [Alphaproteobacteria bacterium]
MQAPQLAAQGLQPPHSAPHGLQPPDLAAQGLQAIRGTTHSVIAPPAPQAPQAPQGLHAPHAPHFAAQGLHAPHAPHLAAQGLQAPHAPHLPAQGLHAPQALQAPQPCATRGLHACALVCVQPVAINPTPSTNGITVVVSSLFLVVPVIFSMSSDSTAFAGDQQLHRDQAHHPIG